MTQSASVQGTATVVGSGPAGLMAAEVLREAGLDVTVFDHKRAVGRKFVLAGRGGLNITKAEPFEDFLASYTTAAAWLEPALLRFGPDDLRAWCASLGEPTFVGSSGRVFPKSFRAVPLLRAWQRRLSHQGVVFAPQHRLVGFKPVADRPGCRVETRFMVNGPEPFDPAERIVDSDVLVLALGGASWPHVGSDGTWTELLSEVGIDVAALRPANCGVIVPWSPYFLDRFAGQPLKNVAVGVDERWVRGEPVVTKRGLEGGPVYAHSQAVRAAIDRDGMATLFINLQPDMDETRLAHRLARRRAKESSSTWLRKAGLAPVAIGLLREATANNLPDDAKSMAALVGAVPLGATSVMPIERAISTAGGVRADNVDDGFMLRQVPGVFVSGEMLDWEAPTGGYLLQACFSTGVAAAHGAIDWLSSQSS